MSKGRCGVQSSFPAEAATKSLSFPAAAASSRCLSQRRQRRSCRSWREDPEGGGG